MEVPGELNFTFHPRTWERRKGLQQPWAGRGLSKGRKAAESLGVRAVTVLRIGFDASDQHQIPPKPKIDEF